MFVESLSSGIMKDIGLYTEPEGSMFLTKSSALSVHSLKVITQILLFSISSVESQKGIIAAPRCSVENQKGAIAVQSQWQ